MAIRNYTLTEEQAMNAKDIYFPGNETLTDQLEFKKRYDDRPNPMILYHLKGNPKSVIQLTLNSDNPLIKHIDLAGEESDIEKMIAAVETDLGIQLTNKTHS